MTTTFIHQTIRRANLNYVLLALAGLIVIVALAFLSRTFYYNVLRGPFTLEEREARSLKSAEGLNEYYVTIKGDDVVDTGFQYVTKNYGIETGHDSYVALVLNDQFLLVQMPGDARDATEYTGSLKSIPGNVQREVLDEIIAEVPEVKGHFLPYMLDTGDFRTPGYISMAVMAAGLVGFAWLLARSIQRLGDTSKHPMMKALGRLGDEEQIAEQIDQEMSQEHQTVGKNLHLTNNWLVYRTAASFSAARMSDVAWMYKHVTQHRTNGIPTGKTFMAMIYDRYGTCIQVPGKEKQVLAALEAVARRSPWAVIGYENRIDAAWKQDRAGFIAAVDRRRADMGNQ